MSNNTEDHLPPWVQTFEELKREVRKILNDDKLSQ